MSEPYPSRLLDRFMLRMPDGLRERLAEAAKANSRSMNAEVVMAIEAWLSHRDPASALLAEKTYDPSVGSGGLLAAMTDFVAKHPGLRITLDLRPHDEAEPVRTIGPEDRLADVGDVEGGEAYPRRIDGGPVPPEEQARRDAARNLAEGHRKAERS